MLYTAKDARKCKIVASDGELGSVDDLFFDDRDWGIRYVVVDTGKWLPGKRVLIPSEKLGVPDWRKAELDVQLSREEIEDSPGVGTDPPLAQAARSRHYRSFVWASHPWGGFIGGLATVDPEGLKHVTSDPPKTHIRSAQEVTGYSIEASDGRMGHVEDLLFDAESWTIRYVVIDTRTWLPGKKVVVRPEEIEKLDWVESTAQVDLRKEEVKDAPRLELKSSAATPGPRVMVIH